MFGVLFFIVSFALTLVAVKEESACRRRRLVADSRTGAEKSLSIRKHKPRRFNVLGV